MSLEPNRPQVSNQINNDDHYFCFMVQWFLTHPQIIPSAIGFNFIEIKINSKIRFFDDNWSKNSGNLELKNICSLQEFRTVALERFCEFNFQKMEEFLQDLNLRPLAKLDSTINPGSDAIYLPGMSGILQKDTWEEYCSTIRDKAVQESKKLFIKKVTHEINQRAKYDKTVKINQKTTNDLVQFWLRIKNVLDFKLDFKHDELVFEQIERLVLPALNQVVKNWILTTYVYDFERFYQLPLNTQEKYSSILLEAFRISCEFNKSRQRLPGRVSLEDIANIVSLNLNQPDIRLAAMLLFGNIIGFSSELNEFFDLFPILLLKDIKITLNQCSRDGYTLLISQPSSSNQLPLPVKSESLKGQEENNEVTYFFTPATFYANNLTNLISGVSDAPIFKFLHDQNKSKTTEIK